jgi:hypothetical protein
MEGLMMIDNAESRIGRIDRDGFLHCGKCDAVMSATVEVVFQTVPVRFNLEHLAFHYDIVGEVLRKELLKFTCLQCFHAIDYRHLLLSLPKES